MIEQTIKVKNLNKIEHLAKKFSIWISQWIWLTVMLWVFWIVSTYIGSTPNSLFINDKIKTEQALLGTWTKLQTNLYMAKLISKSQWNRRAN